MVLIQFYIFNSIFMLLNQGITNFIKQVNLVIVKKEINKVKKCTTQIYFCCTSRTFNELSFKIYFCLLFLFKKL